MKRLDNNPILVTTRTLADRWAVDPRTALRACRFHELKEVRLRPGGRILFCLDAVLKIERDIIGEN